MAPGPILGASTWSPSEGSSRDEEFVAALNAKPIPLGGGESVTWPLIEGRRLALPHHMVSLLEYCPGFASLPEHAEAIAQQVGIGAREVLGLLEQLRGHGLLATRREVLDALASQEDKDSDGGAEFLVMTTSSRPHLVAANLRRYVEGSQFEKVLLADDSTDTTDQERNRQVAEELDATYIGSQQKRALVADLAIRARIPRELLSWALQSPSIGGNRNAVLLATAGSLFLSVDDDTTGLVARPPSSENTVVVSSRSDPTEFWFDDLPEPGQLDLRAAHHEYLGKRVAEVLRTRPFDLGIDGARIAFQSTGRISATTSGMIGDSGMRSARYLLRLKGPSRDRLMANFERALRSRRMLRAPTQPSLGPAGWFMTLAVGLDNRDILPPFLPIGRNSDGLFGSILRQVRPHDLVASLPLAVGHEPPTERSFSETEAIGWYPSVCDLLIPVVNRVDNPSSGACNRLRWLGRYLGELASQSEAAFHEEIVSVVADVQSRVTLHLESLLEVYHGRPGDWAASVDDSISFTRDLLTDFPMPSNMRTSVQSYGRLLNAWPEVHAAAVEWNTQ